MRFLMTWLGGVVCSAKLFSDMFLETTFVGETNGPYVVCVLAYGSLWWNGSFTVCIENLNDSAADFV